MNKVFILIFVLAFLLTACTQTQAASTATNTPIPPTLTNTSEPTDTPEPTITPTAMPLPTMIPTAVLPGNALNLTYIITIDNPDSTQPTAHVSIEVRNCSIDKLYFLVGWPYNVNDYRNFTPNVKSQISDIIAKKTDASSLNVSSINNISDEDTNWHGEAWAVNTMSTPHFYFNFQELLLPPYASQSFSTLSMLPVGQDIDSITVIFKLPPGWKATTPWTAINSNEFEVPCAWGGCLYNYATASIGLAPINLQERKKSLDDFEVVFYGNFSSPAEEYMTKIIQWLADIHGGYDYPQYTFLGDGIRCIRCVSTYVASTDQGWARNFQSGSERDYLLRSYDGGINAFGLPVVTGFHEFSHAWNVSMFRGTNNSNGEWWHNGIANYFEIIGPEEVFGQSDVSRAWLYMAWDYYRDHLDTSYNLPVVMLDPDPEGAQEPRLMAYFKNALFYYMLDQELSNSGSSVEELVAYLYAHFKPNQQPGTPSDFMAAVNILAEQDMTPFFNKYFTGNEPFPLEYLDEFETDYINVFGER